MGNCLRGHVYVTSVVGKDRAAVRRRSVRNLLPGRGFLMIYEL